VVNLWRILFGPISGNMALAKITPLSRARDNFDRYLFDVKGACMYKGAGAAIVGWEKPTIVEIKEGDEAGERRVVGTKLKYADDVKIEHLQIALGIITTTIEGEDLVSVIRDCEDPREALYLLHRQFYRNSALQLLTLKKQLESLRMEAGMTVAQLLDKMRRLRREIERLDDPSTGKKVAVYDVEMIMCLQRALYSHPRYSGLAERWATDMAEKKIITFNDACERALELEKVKEGLEANADEHQRMDERVLQTSHGTAGGRQGTPTDDGRCYGCGGLGHIKRRCPSVRRRTGSGSGQRPADQQLRRDFSKVKCFTCGQTGHISRSCPSRRNGQGEKAMVAMALTGFVVDTGCTAHMVHDRRLLEGPTRPCDTPISGVGGLAVRAALRGKLRNFPGEALLVEGMRDNLLSMAQLCKYGWHGEFSQRGMQLRAPDGRVYEATSEGNLYRLSERCYVAAADTGEADRMEWHRRLGHMSDKPLRLACADTTDVSKWPEGPINCLACAEAKLTKTPVRRVATHEEDDMRLQPGERIDVDMWGPMAPSIGNKRMALEAKDRRTRMVFVRALGRKNEAAMEMAKILDRELGPFQRHCARLHGDRAGDFEGGDWRDMCAERGITATYSSSDTPAHNGFIERQHRDTQDTVRTMLLDAGLGVEFWAEAMVHAAYLHNARPLKILGNISPFEAWTGQKPRLQGLLPFGTRVLFFSKDGRFGKRGQTGIYLGPALDTVGGAARILNIATDRVITTRDFRIAPGIGVKFMERTGDDAGNESEDEGIDTSDAVAPDEQPAPVPGAAAVDAPVQGDAPATVPATARQDPTTQTATAPAPVPAASTADGPDSIQPRRSARIANQSVIAQTGRPATSARGAQKISASAVGGQPADPTVGETPATSYLACEMPRTLQQALELPDATEWTASMFSEIESLFDRDVFEVVDISNVPTGCKFFGATWVNRVKTDENNKPVRYKSRLTVQGCAQVEGIDYDAISSPVTSREGARTVFAFAASQGWEMRQFDFDTAYLNAALDRPIYMRPFDGLLELGGHRLNKYELGLLKSGRAALRVRKALYGLKQSGRLWYETVAAHFTDVHGLKPTETEPCIFVGDGMVVMLYVDDGIVACAPGSGLDDQFLEKLSGEFAIKLLGEPRHFVGWRITKEPGGSYLINQRGYIEAMGERFGIDGHAKHVPISPGTVLGDGEHGDKQLFMSSVGSLLFASGGTRPDIATATSMLSRHMNGPTVTCVKAARDVLRYLQTTADLGIRMTGPADEIVIEVYSDASFASDECERRSRGGFIVMLNGSPVAWRSTLQRIQAHSTAEAEYIAMSEGARYGVYVRQLVQEMGGAVRGPIIMHQDNRTAKIMAEEITTKRSKHVDIAHHFVRGLVRRGEVDVRYCRTDEMLADVMTKLLPRDTLERLRDRFMVMGEC
jgi:transposase InsO family protein